MLRRSPFTDLGSVARHHYRIAPDIVLKGRFPVAGIVAGLDVPITVVYGTADSIAESVR